MMLFSLIFDHYFLPLLWLWVGRGILFTILNVIVHLNALFFFLGFLSTITALTKKRNKKWLIIFTVVYFVGGFIILFNVLFLPADAELLASQTFRWPLIASYSLF